MYLKRLEIQGFKSFADKVEFEFPSGITAIVGPNGSGKSNVVDSIRWVLGEQSVKSLRGSKMEDVIFAGSSDRRAVGMAQVSMTIDNSEHLLALDFDEITVTRRLYRSGESEYLINKSPCRLKDIHELFMDTGLGREGLSIISQGKVDEILTLKPEDRRGLIEEAAGIVKYKYRKREAERKLADTEENMVRIHDIISELSERVEPLGEQAEKAKQYKIWKEDLDKLEISVEVADIEKNKAKEEQLLGEKQNIENQVAGFASQLAKKEVALSEEKFAEQADEEEMTQLQQHFFSLQGEIDRRKNDIEAAKEMVNHVEQQKGLLQKEISDQQQELTDLQEQIAKQQNEATNLKGNFVEEEKQLDDLQAQAVQDEQEQFRLEQAVEEQKNKQFANMQEQARIHNEIQRLNQDLFGGDRRQERQEEKLQSINLQLSETVSATIDLQESYEEKLALQENHLRKIEALEQELENRKQEQFVMQKALNDIQMRYQESFSKKEALTELEHSGEGYQYGVKSVLEQKNEGKLEGIIGTVAQLIKVPQKYEKAVETAMGVSLQNIVTEDDSQAQKAIQYLKEQKKGRVTFLPLNTVKGMRAEEDLSQEANVIGLAVDLIEFEGRYQQILLHLLGKVWIVKDLSSAVNIGKKRGFSHRLVTLDGELITPGGALTGGNHNKEQKGLLLRQRQIEELTEQVAELQQKMDDKNQELDDFYLITIEKQQQLNNLKEERTEFVQQVAALHQQLEQNAKDQKRLENEQHLEQQVLEEMLQEKVQAADNLKKAQQLEIELKEKENDLKEEIVKLQEQQQAQLQAIKIHQEELQSALIQFATAKQRWEIMQQQYLEVEGRAEQLQQTIKQKEENYRTLLNQYQMKQQEIVEHQQYVEEHLPKLQAENQQLELK
ncbi:MAG: chromosome segregation protein SMC, partial [Peptococcaceae bacterium]|nr:chromosome segregation protein SMC [Peptococcaceae bacterium]